MGYSSASEGEIVDSDGEKATKTRPSTRDSAINRKSRPRSPLSRSPRPLLPDGAHDDSTPAHALDYGDAAHTASSSTSGKQHQFSSGQKRRYEDHAPSSRNHHDSARRFDLDDPRRFEVRYDLHDASDGRRRGPHYPDSTSSHRPSRHHGRFDDREPPEKRYQSDRYRARSRSRSSDRARAHGHAAPSRGHRREVRGEKPSRFNQSDADRDRNDSRTSTHGRRAEDRSTSGQLDQAMPDAVAGTSAPRYGPATQRLNRHPSLIANAVNSLDASQDEDRSATAVDEAKLIEERRKRREALRAKHRGQNTPLLQKALEQNAASQPGTPSAADPSGMFRTPRVPCLCGRRLLISEAAVPPDASSPSTPNFASPGSPLSFSISSDCELANPAQATLGHEDRQEGTSAADYDPNMDMQEVSLRERRVEGDTEASASKYDEANDDDRAVVIPQTTEEHVSQTKASKEFDMFADDDDDNDMFAPEPANGPKKDDGTQAVRIPEAKQLDRSLLDDWDDPEGYYRIILGELLDARYHVQTNLGKGVFSAVVRALDAQTDRLVAIKIIRKQESMYKAGMKEIEILQQLAEADPDDRKHVIRLERHFEHKGHLCMVFENLSINLREVLKKFGRDIGINIKAVRSYAQQMFLGLSLLKKCEILHADLKPDNVLVNESRSQLKIADLGSAVSARDNEVTDVLVSRFYRAPEIMLGIRHDYAIDMWSIGCTLFELYTGKICFTGPTNNQMLRVIMECRGKIPNRLLKKAEFWAQHFDADGTFLSQEFDQVTRKDVVRRMNINRTNPSKELKARLFNNAKGLNPTDAKELSSFADLLDKCLALDPARRITPLDALKHDFITRASMHSK